MKTKLKFVLPLLIAFVSSTTLEPCLADEPSKENATGDVVKFTFGGVPFDMDGMATSLASALEQHPKATKYRTDWQYSEGGGSGIGAVLYDRQLKRLKYFEQDSDGSGVSTFLYTYGEVTETMLLKLGTDLQDQEKRREALADTKIVFDALTKRGAKKKGGWRYRNWGEKEPSLRGK